MSDRTVRRCLNTNGYHFLQARKKGLLLSQDLKKRITFAKEVRRIYPRNVVKQRHDLPWNRKVSYENQPLLKTMVDR